MNNKMPRIVLGVHKFFKILPYGLRPKFPLMRLNKKLIPMYAQQKSHNGVYFLTYR